MKIMSSLVVGLLVGPTLAVSIAQLLPGGNLWWVILRASAPLAIIPNPCAHGSRRYSVATSWPGPSHRVNGIDRGGGVARASCPVGGRTLDGHAEGSPVGRTIAVMTANLHIGRADPGKILAIVAAET